VLSVHRRRAHAVPCRRGAVGRRRAPSLAIEEQSHRPSPLRSRRAVPRRRGAVAPSIAVEEPSRRASPSRSRRPCRLTTPATRLAPSSLSSSGWLSRCLSSRQRLPSACASHCGHRLSCLSSIWPVVPSPRFSSASASPSLIAPSPPLVTPISGLLSGWLRRRLSSRRRHLSAG
jgi:hypothetical protein